MRSISGLKVFVCRVFVVVALAVGSTTAEGQGAAPAPIRDNSFLLEEAHNQEPGVIQHISAFLRERDGSFSYSFTEEWPVKSERHQLSVTFPVEKLFEGQKSTTGIGDALINYRFQAAMLESHGVAVAPRLSLIVPSGSEKKGLGSGHAGVEFNLPISLEPSSRLALHFNAGGSVLPGQSTSRLFGGASAIFLASKNANLMLELFHSAEASRGPRFAETILLPGVRFALNHKSGLQVVPGFGVPVRLGGESKGRIGIFAYLSFEHPL